MPDMALQGLFVGLDPATLVSMRTEWLACLSAIASGHQSYSISGRTFNRAQLNEVSQMVAEVQFAIDLRAGTRARKAVADMSSPL